LANDEVKDGFSERGGFPVEKKKMSQWFLRITAYAQRLLTGLETLDWSDSMKEMQRNWIGKSIGAMVKFEIKNHSGFVEVFTTRIDTIFGVSFMVIAPEHELVDLISTSEYKEEIKAYQKYCNTRTDTDRQSDVKNVTGQFLGAYAINPFNGVEVPILLPIMF
jgi:leucyl-tRNA synthetase